MQCDMKKAIEQEQKEHPWADEDIARKLVEDHLREDPDYYGSGDEGGEEEDDSALFGPTREDDPYPEEEEKEHHHGQKKPTLVIAMMSGKEKDNRDPYPED